MAFLLMLLVISQVTEAQRRNPNAGNNPVTRQDTSGLTTDIREKLVQLALQNPEFEIADRQVTIADQNVRMARLRILGQVTAQVNYNEYSIKQPSGAVANYYPRYNLGLSLPFDLFFTRDKEVNIARENLGIAEASKNQTFRNIKAQVLTAYEDYLMYKTKLEFQNQITEDVKTVYQQKERDFSEGIISAEEYYPAFKVWTDELTKKAEQQRNFNIAKLTLESIIGMTLEEAIAK